MNIRSLKLARSWFKRFPNLQVLTKKSMEYSKMSHKLLKIYLSFFNVIPIFELF